MYKRLSGINVADNLGNRVFITFIIKSVEVRPQKNNKEYMTIIMKDKDTEVEAKIFDIDSNIKEKVSAGKVYNAAVDVRPYAKGKDGLSCIVYNIDYSDVPVSEFEDWVDNIEVYYNIINNFIIQVSSSKIGKITYNILAKHWDKFTRWPAAMNQHHSSMGGLVMHTACITQACYNEAMMYNKIYGDIIDTNLLICAALLHDIMKVEELDITDGNIGYSGDSALETHIISVIKEVSIEASKVNEENSKEVKELIHCIAAHHGLLEYGSPIEPHMIEAMILNKQDEIDADIWRYSRKTKALKAQTYYSEWASGGIKVYYKSAGDTKEQTDNGQEVDSGASE